MTKSSVSNFLKLKENCNKVGNTNIRVNSNIKKSLNKKVW